MWVSKTLLGVCVSTVGVVVLSRGCARLQGCGVVYCWVCNSKCVSIGVRRCNGSR